MTNQIKFSTTIVPFGNQTCRYVGGGYKSENLTLEEMFLQASKIKDISGVEVVATWNINEGNIDQIKKLSAEYGLQISCVIVDTFSQAKWGKGGFSSQDAKIRKEAIDHVKKYMDISKDVGCNIVDVWFGQDGYDYCFQTDYLKSWNYLEEGLRQCADYRKDVNLAIEYKHKEPRIHCFVSDIGKTINLIKKVNRGNIGIVMDVGHAQLADENPAESIALCKYLDTDLLHLHLNDNYKTWDDDIMFGAYHIQEELELLYWLKRIGYSGWYSFDIFPYRENGLAAVQTSLNWLKDLINAVNSVKDETIEEVLGMHDATESLELIRKMIFK
jgi:sugar phosphate isomerase/epimerase